MIVLQYKHVSKQEDVRTHIRFCEGKHTQQAIYSTFHDALTQVCYGCRAIRSTIPQEDTTPNLVLARRVPLTGFQEDEGRTRLEELPRG